MKVKYCKYGLANYYEDHIEINISLKKNKKLRDLIVKHELGHSNKFDLLHEINPLLGIKAIPFLLMHPSCWVDFLPIRIRNKEIIYDKNLIILYIIFAILVIIKIK